MDPVTNPYVPNAGATPPELSGRKGLIDAFVTALGRAASGRTPKSIIPYGLRGVGKTVLLNRFTHDAREARYEIAYIEADDGGGFVRKLAGELRRILLSLDAGTKVNEAIKKAIRVLKSFVVKVQLTDLSFELGVDPEPGIGDTGELTTDLTALLVSVGQAAQSQGTAVLIAVDEVQYVAEPDFKALIMALHRVTQLSLPVLAVVTGLPQVLALAGDAKTYAERLFEYSPIGALSREDTFAAIEAPAAAEGVRFTEAALQRLYELTEGYPFFVQEWSYHTWNAATQSPIGRDVIDAIEAGVIARLDQGFFRTRYDRTTHNERRYLRAMAELGTPCRTADVSALLGQRLGQSSPVRDGLIKKGMIYSPQIGEVAFTVPLFTDYMKRAEPTFVRNEKS